MAKTPDTIKAVREKVRRNTKRSIATAYWMKNSRSLSSNSLLFAACAKKTSLVNTLKQDWINT